MIPTFIAGLLTFLAPCTLPLIPAYLGFISGVSAKDLQDATKISSIRSRVMKNAIFYVIGFSAVFISLGILFGLGGAVFGNFRVILMRIGGVFIIFFGLYLMGIFERLPFLRFLSSEKRIPVFHSITPGSPLSSFIFGATFAFGWTPCIGPILGSVLLLVTSTATVIEGGLLLGIFSLGLALPFLVLAFGIGHASSVMKILTRYLPVISIVGGLFLVFLGILLFTNQLSLWLIWVYKHTNLVGYNQLLDYL